MAIWQLWLCPFVAGLYNKPAEQIIQNWCKKNVLKNKWIIQRIVCTYLRTMIFRIDALPPIPLWPICRSKHLPHPRFLASLHTFSEVLAKAKHEWRSDTPIAHSLSHLCRWNWEKWPPSGQKFQNASWKSLNYFYTVVSFSSVDMQSFAHTKNKSLVHFSNMQLLRRTHAG